MIIRILIATAITLIIIWSGYWFAFKDMHQNAVDKLFLNFREQGKTANYSSVSVQGYPSRYDTTFEDLLYFDPDKNYGWSADFLQILALSYRPQEMIFALSEQHTIKYEDEIIEMNAEKLRSSLFLQDIRDVSFDSFIAESESILLQGSSGWRMHILQPIMGFRLVEDKVDQIEFDLQLELLPSGFKAPVGGWFHTLAKDLSSIKIGFNIIFDGKFTPENCRDGTIRIDRIELLRGQFRWRDNLLEISSNLTVSEGKISGVMSLDPGAFGFSSLVGKFSLTEDPRVRRNIQNAAKFIDSVNQGKLEANIKDGYFNILGFPLIEFANIPYCSGLSQSTQL